ncbi:MAG: DUF4974 domain-containing protein [Muribaculaceae bacterium]|nr:DUF4974 domain-containing protein [Muribaculaceae bacterium]
MMDKTELLFRMMEQPEKYNEGQWREILSDKECHELYTMMAAARSAVEAERYDQQADDTTVQQEWERFVAKHPHAGNSSRPIWRRVAAVAAVIVIAASIVVAAVHTRGFGLQQERQSSDDSTQQTPVTATSVTSDITENQEVIPTLTDNEAHLYDDISLEQIIDDMTAKYNIQEVEWRSEEAKSLRLYYRWEPSYSLDKVVDMLNSFQAFTIQRAGNKLIISDIDSGQ